MFISEPCKLSSILLLCNVPYTIYVRNYTILWTQIPVGVTSILLHHNIYRKIRLTDNVFANLALLQHSYHSYLFGNRLSNFFYLLTPMIFVISKILLYKKKTLLFTGYTRFYAFCFMYSNDIFKYIC